MFDIGFSELLLVAVIALVVLGPERLPKAARLAGLWVRRARAQWYAVKSELEHELAAEELQRSLRETREAVQRTGDDLRATGESVRRDFDDLERIDPDRNDEVPPPPPPADEEPHGPER